MIKNNLKELLRIRNMSQKEFAEKLGTTEASISRYVNGERIPKIHTVFKMADILRCNERILFPLEEQSYYVNVVSIDEEREFSSEGKVNCISCYDSCLSLKEAFDKLEWYKENYPRVIMAYITDGKGNVLWHTTFRVSTNNERIDIL